MSSAEYKICPCLCIDDGRERLITQMLGSQSKVTPKLRDVHAAVLFLEAADCLSIGAEGTIPPCWELFHSELFHFLCQNSTFTSNHTCLNVEAVQHSARISSEYQARLSGNV